MNIEKLSLSETYSFHVVVQSGDEHFAGKLMLSPTKCTLRITGEESDARKFGFQKRIERLLCRHRSSVVVLLGLEATGAFFGTVDRKAGISSFEASYTVSYVIYNGSPSVHVPNCFGVALDAKEIGEWVGHTHGQSEILRDYESGVFVSEGDQKLREFEQSLTGIGSLTVDYNWTAHYSPRDFEAGLRFPPTLVAFFNSARVESEVVSFIGDLIALFAVLLGTNLTLDNIMLNIGAHRGPRPCLYFSMVVAPPRARASSLLFPLSRNMVHNQLALPEFPLQAIDAYFQLAEGERELFKKYVRYRELENSEERFLGYFRLLEKLTHQKEHFVDEEKLVSLATRSTPYLERFFGDPGSVRRLLKQVLRANGSKLNAAGCIIRFMKVLPAELTDRWRFSNQHVEAICKFRNDLTHANEAEPSGTDIAVKEKFIEVLLVIALFLKLGVPAVSVAVIAGRIERYRAIVKE